MRMRLEIKERLDRVSHPGQSYDGIIEEMLDFWEQNHPTGGAYSPSTEVPRKKDGEGDWWWSPQGGKGGKKAR